MKSKKKKYQIKIKEFTVWNVSIPIFFFINVIGQLTMLFSFKINLLLTVLILAKKIPQVDFAQKYFLGISVGFEKKNHFVQ